MPDTVLVIGGMGRTGRLVVGRLQQQQRPVRVMSRRTAAEEPGVDAVLGSITDADAVRAAVQGCAGVVISVEPPADRAGAQATLATACAWSPRSRATRGQRSCWSVRSTSRGPRSIRR